VIISSLGHLDLKGALLGLLKVPATYAILLALLFIETGWTFPEPISRTLSLAAGGAIPGMLILLGLELQQIEWSRNFSAMGISVFTRLLIGPLIGLGLAILFGLPIPARQAGVTEMSGPTAVMTTVLATEYKLDSKLVTAIVFITTILSPLSLTLVLYYLGR
jgi:predicted permease